jgi:hypothetical protein
MRRRVTWVATAIRAETGAEPGLMTRSDRALGLFRKPSRTAPSKAQQQSHFGSGFRASFRKLLFREQRKSVYTAAAMQERGLGPWCASASATSGLRSI